MSVVDELLGGPRTRLHIGGEWAEGDGELDVIDPATEQVFAAVAMAGRDQARAAVDAAAAAAPEWAATAPRVRSEILRRSYETMLDREEQLAELIVLENGKTYSDALGEVRYAAEFFRWFSEEAVRITGEFRTAPAGDKRIIRRAGAGRDLPHGHSMELPLGNGDSQAGTGSGGRLHHHPQARFGHAPLRPGPWRTFSRRPGSRPVWSTWSLLGVHRVWWTRCSKTRGCGSCPLPGRPRWAGC